MSFSRAELESAISIASVLKDKAEAELAAVRATGPFELYTEALRKFMSADLEHLQLVNMRERQRVGEAGR